MRTSSIESRWIGSLTVVLLSIGLGSLAGSDCWAGIIRHDRDAEEYRKLGQEPGFQCVGQAGVKPLGEPIRFGGGVVLVSPRWVLTAGHVSIRSPQEPSL